ncbi:hypothetical protein BDW62DRAFT_45347 [Aspergillus aurantiobrunneus]
MFSYSYTRLQLPFFSLILLLTKTRVRAYIYEDNDHYCFSSSNWLMFVFEFSRPNKFVGISTGPVFLGRTLPVVTLWVLCFSSMCQN